MRDILKSIIGAGLLIAVFICYAIFFAVSALATTCFMPEGIAILVILSILASWQIFDIIVCLANYIAYKKKNKGDE